MPLWRALLAWTVTRGVTVWLLCTDERLVLGDVHYYHQSVATLGIWAGVSETLVEYPVPAVVLLWLPYAALALVAGTEHYLALVPALAVLTDLLFFASLLHARRWSRPRRTVVGIPVGEWAWLLAAPALGAITYGRFDLLPGVLVGLAVLHVVHRPAVAAVFGALATGVKYWPAIVLPTLAAPRVGRTPVLATISVVGGGLAVGSLLLGGWGRLFSPFDYQDDRGLQIEAVAATPAMLAWAGGADGYRTQMTQYNAWEVSGPMVGGLIQLAAVATLVVGVLLVGLVAAAWMRLEDRDVDVLLWLGLAAVGGFVVTSKVFSPQYLLWFLPAAAAGLVVARSERTWRRLAGWTGVLLVAALLTHVVFPRHYGDLLSHGDDSLRMALVLLLRNLLVVGLFGYAALQAGLLLRRRSESSPDRVSTRAPLDAAS